MSLLQGFVYKWVNTINNKYYYGSHKGSIEDGYLASGTRIKSAFEKYGIENFTREILYVGPDFREVEELILETINASALKDCYNLKNTSIGGDTLSNHPRKVEIYKNRRDYFTEDNPAKKPEYIAKRSGENHYMKSPDKLRKAVDNKIKSGVYKKLSEKFKGANNPNYGKGLTYIELSTGFTGPISDHIKKFNIQDASIRYNSTLPTAIRYGKNQGLNFKKIK